MKITIDIEYDFDSDGYKAVVLKTDGHEVAHLRGVKGKGVDVEDALSNLIDNASWDTSSYSAVHWNALLTKWNKNVMDWTRPTVL
jgi:hypothetical protein